MRIGDALPQPPAASATWQERALDYYYHSRPGWVGGTVRFHDLITRHVPPGSEILELGAGPDNPTTAFLAGLGPVTGLDVDPAVRENRHCRRAAVYDGLAVPFASGQFDAVVANYVCEHVERPRELCREIRRVLRPGGRFIFRTPNLWHYVSLVAAMTPDWFHRRVANRVRNLPPDAHEPYPTFHRMNTRSACRRLLRGSGFRVDYLHCIEAEPSYGMASRLLFFPFLLWERVLNSHRAWEDLRSNILCVASAAKSGAP